MLRVEGWERRLMALIEERRRAPFAWGTNDCISFASDAVMAITGIDPLAAWRGTYAADAIFDLLTIEREFGRGRQQIAAARRGDIVLMPTSVSIHGAAVCLGELSAAPGEHGLIFNRTRMAKLFWPVGWEYL